MMRRGAGRRQPTAATTRGRGGGPGGLGCADHELFPSLAFDSVDCTTEPDLNTNVRPPRGQRQHSAAALAHIEQPSGGVSLSLGEEALAPDPTPPLPDAARLSSSATVLGAASLDPAALQALPASDITNANDVAAAVGKLVRAANRHPLASFAHRAAVSEFRASVSALCELLGPALPPMASLRAPIDCTRWHRFLNELQATLLPVVLTNEVLVLLLEAVAADHKPRPSASTALLGWVRVCANALHQHAPAQLRNALRRALNPLMLLEACSVAANSHSHVDVTPFVGIVMDHVVEAISTSDVVFDPAARGYVMSAVRRFASDIAASDPRMDSWLVQQRQSLYRRLQRLQTELGQCVAPVLVPFATVLIHLEQVIAHHALARHQLVAAFQRDEDDPISGEDASVVVRIPSPQHCESQLWLRVVADSRRILSFAQWTPALFVGQHVVIAASDNESAEALQFTIRRVGMHDLIIACNAIDDLQAALPWAVGTKLRVSVQHNEWFLNTLIATRRHPRVDEFLAALDGRRPWPPVGPLRPLAALDDTPRHAIVDDANQRRFVQLVLARPRLVCLRGPPGTGKTHSIVAAIVALIADGCSPILACATSALAADALALRLVDHGVDVHRVYTRSSVPLDVATSPFAQVLRYSSAVVDPSRRESDEHKEPVRFDDIDVGSVFESTAPSALSGHDVVVTTTAHTQWMQRAYPSFRCVFVDEVGQATVPEALLPLTFVAPTATLVLAGDTMQLGPSVVTDIAAEFGLGTSILERYQEELTKSNNTVDLLTCYRCMPSIMNLFNGLYYRGSLRAAVAPNSTPALPSQNGLDGSRGGAVRCSFSPTASSSNHGVIFVDVPANASGAKGRMGLNTGDDVDTVDAGCHDSSSTRFVNAAEAETIAAMIQRLVEDNGGPTFRRRIAVVTAFKQQALLIMELLSRDAADLIDDKIHHRRIPGVLVGTVEQFQGQEFDVVVVSTVRPERDFLFPGAAHAIGLVGNDRKTNVAISRARLLLILVGDLSVLQQHPQSEPWRKITDFVIAQHAAISVRRVLEAPRSGRTATMTSRNGRNGDERSHSHPPGLVANHDEVFW